MASLNVRLLGIEFPNPFILASSLLTRDAKRIVNAFESGWGGAVLNTVSLAPPVRLGTKSSTLRSGSVKWGSVGAKAVSDLTIEQWGGEIDRIRNSFPDRPLIASIIGDDTASSWVECVSHLQEFPIDAFEVDTGFSISASGQAAPRELGQNPQALAQALGWVRHATSLPVIVKLSPNVTDIGPIARTAIEGGADALVATGGLSGQGVVDIDRVTLPSWGNDSRLEGEYTGPGLKPVALHWTAEIAKSLSIPVIGCGGVSTWQDAAEYFAVGANTVEVRSAAMWHGIEIISDLTSGFQAYLEEMNLGDPNELVGRALSRIVGFDELDLDYKMVAILDEPKCIGCELCMRVCNDAGFQAIVMEGGIARVANSKCDGCGLCIYVCPPDIMAMVPREQM
jgi:dihydropyrimidine dehydrogenase (NAD+) subunit PreA